MKCKICNNKIEKTFLNKIVGTIINENGKKTYICNHCQKEMDTKK